MGAASEGLSGGSEAVRSWARALREVRCVCREWVETSERESGSCVAFYTHTHACMHICM